jgi:heat-inducible transcriptional repressor
VLTPTHQSALRHVEFVSLGGGVTGGQALAVIVFEDGHVENRIMDMPAGVLPSSLEMAGNYLSARLRGKTLDRARTDILKEIKQGEAALDMAAKSLIKQGLADWSGHMGQKRSLIVRGRSRLLDNVDVRSDLERVQRLFEDLERKEDLIALLDRAETADGVKIFIGAENPLFSLSGSSVVVAPYRDSAQNIIGAVGVIGPTRLNYARVIPMVDYTAQIVGRLLEGGS